MTLLPFPTPLGALDANGRVCVGVGGSSRSKACRTTLRLYDPATRLESEVLATKVKWKEHDAKTIAVLLDCLRDVLHTKGVVPFDRGTVVGRYVGSRFYLMEVCRDVLFPRYKWWLPYQISGWHNVVPTLITYETWFPTTLFAEPDERRASQELTSDPDKRQFAPVRMMGNHRQWAEEVLTVRQVQSPASTA